jgi:hypothetical protein
MYPQYNFNTGIQYRNTGLSLIIALSCRILPIQLSLSHDDDDEAKKKKLRLGNTKALGRVVYQPVSSLGRNRAKAATLLSLLGRRTNLFNLVLHYKYYLVAHLSAHYTVNY